MLQLILVLSLFTLPHSVNAQDWAQKADMINPRLFFSVSTVDKEIYVIGGTRGNPIDNVEAYLPDTDKWVQKANLTSPRVGVVTCEVGGKIYAISGWDGQNPALGTVEEYDPTTDTWRKKADMPTPRSFFVAVAAVGGTSQVQGPGLSTVEMYDPLSDTWAKGTDMPTARVFLGAGTVNRKIYAIGGVAEGLGPKILPTVEEFNLGVLNVAPLDKRLTSWGNIK